MRVLVTGGTGYLGSAVVNAVARRGHRALVFARSASAAVASGRVTGEPVDGDVRDRGALERAATGCDAICHTAALVSLWQPRASLFDEVNVGGLENVLAVARALGIPRVVYTSSFLARPPAGAAEPLTANDYQRTKVIADRLAARAIEEGAPLVRLYPGVLYGAGAATEGNLLGGLLRDQIAGRLPGIVGADRIWSFAYVSDVADAHVAALERAPIGASYDLGGENATQIRAFEIAQAIAGVPLPRRLPAALAYAAGAVEELRARFTGRPPLVTRGAVAILTRDWPLGRERAAAELDYRVTPLDQGVQAVLRSLGCFTSAVARSGH